MATQLTQVTFPTGDYIIDTNTWRGIQDNLTSSTNTTESLSAKQGYLLANGSARDNTKLPLSGGTMTGQIVLSQDGFKTKHSAGYTVDQYGNFRHQTNDATQYWNLQNKAGSNIFSIYWENGNVNAAGTVTASRFIGIKEADLEWGGKNFVGSYGCIDAALMDELGANRFQFIKASAITVEYSRDNGETWTDYGATDAQKQQIFAQGGGLVIGKADSTHKATEHPGEYQLRITIDTGVASVYSYLNKFVIYVSTNNSGNCSCKIQKALQSTPTTFVDHTDWISVTGWSGYNVINTSYLPTYGNSPSSQYGRVRFIFKDSTSTGTTYNGLAVIQIKAFGGVGWSTPSTMAKTGHLYSYKENQTAIFPYEVYATAFYENNVALSSKYFALSGGTITGVPKFGSGSISAFSGNIPYILGIEAFADGGAVKWKSSSDVTVGSATTASKLGSSNVGSATQPIYLNGGTATACTYTLGKSVPSDAVFTDTNTNVTQTATSTNADYEVLFSGTADNTTRTEGARKDDGFLYNPSKDALTVGSRKSGSTVGTSSVATGYNLTASGNQSHAEGYGTTASGDDSHAEGFSTKASGGDAHAEGAWTTASGGGAHAEGASTTASGIYSHAEGYYTTAAHKSQHVFGEYNIADPSTAVASSRGNYIEIVGNGTADDARSNARTLDWDSNEWLAGNLTLGGASSDIILNGTNNTWDGNHTSLKGALTPQVVSDSTVNLNNYTSSGKFILTGTISTKTNFPITQPGYLEVTRWAESSTDHYCRQDFKVYNKGMYAPVVCSRLASSSNGGSTWDWSAWYSENYMLPNETLDFAVGYPAYGFVTTSGKEMHLFFPVHKYLNFTNGVKTMPSSISCTIRQNGNYIGTDFGAATCYPKDWYRQKNIMELVVYNTNNKNTATAWKNATNNCEVVAVVGTAFNIVYS